MIFNYLVIFLVAGSLFPNISEASKGDCVILLHGLGRTHHSMLKLERTLIKNHYFVVNDNYPSTKKSINELAYKYLPPMIDQCLKHHPKHIHFVTHSLGGIILQQYLQKNTLPELQNIVMLSPPNHGSQLVDRLHKNKISQFILGPSFMELETKRQDILMREGRYKIGIIAGTYNLNPLGRLIFAEPNDGKVSVSSTQMKRMNDFISLPVTHTFIMQNPEVEKQILYFLTHGNFMH